jgi:hypothetical protein
MKYTVHSDKLEDLLRINLITDLEIQRIIKRDVDKNGSATHGHYKYFLSDYGYGVQAK